MAVDEKKWQQRIQNYFKVIGTVLLIVWKFVVWLFFCSLILSNVFFLVCNFFPFLFLYILSFTIKLYKTSKVYSCNSPYWQKTKPSFQMNELIRTNAQNKWIYLDNLIYLSYFLIEIIFRVYAIYLELYAFAMVLGFIVWQSAYSSCHFVQLIDALLVLAIHFTC